MIIGLTFVKHKNLSDLNEVVTCLDEIYYILKSLYSHIDLNVYGPQGFL